MADAMRLLRHLFAPLGAARCSRPTRCSASPRRSPPAKLRHAGEICFAVEPALHSARGAARACRRATRAREAFAQLRVWDTERQQRRAALPAAGRPPHRDRRRPRPRRPGQRRAVARRLPAIEERLRAGEAEAAVICAASTAISDLLAEHFPRDAGRRRRQRTAGPAALPVADAPASRDRVPGSNAGSRAARESGITALAIRHDRTCTRSTRSRSAARAAARSTGTA